MIYGATIWLVFTLCNPNGSCETRVTAWEGTKMECDLYSPQLVARIKLPDQTVQRVTCTLDEPV